MSWSIQSLVWDLKGSTKLSALERFVFLCIADRASDKGIAWPSISDIMDRSGISRRSVVNATTSLQKKNFMVKEKRKRKDGSQTSNRYAINVAKLESLRKVHHVHGGVPHGHTMNPQRTSSNTTPLPPKKYRLLSKRFLHAQKKNWPNYLKRVTTRQIDQGAVELQKLVRIDRYQFSQVQEVMEWLPTIHSVDAGFFWWDKVRGLTSIRSKCKDGLMKFAHVLEEYDNRNKPKSTSKAADRRAYDKEPPTKDDLTKVHKAAPEVYHRMKALCGPGRDTLRAADSITEWYYKLPWLCRQPFHESGDVRWLIGMFIEWVRGELGIQEVEHVDSCAVDGTLWQKFLRHLEDIERLGYRKGREGRELD